MILRTDTGNIELLGKHAAPDEGCPHNAATVSASIAGLANALAQVGKARVIWREVGERLAAVEQNLQAGAVPAFNADLADKGADRLHAATIALAAQVRRMERGQ